MVVTTATDRQTTPRKDERLTYVLRAPEKRHRFGISALAVSDQELFTAGRDGTVRAWTLPSTEKSFSSSSINHPTDPLPSISTPKSGRIFDEHVDWVNDVLLVRGTDRLVSCSSDTTIKIWDAKDSTRSVHTLVEHTDYVKALTQVSNGIASGSLDGRVLIWDLTTGRIITECGGNSDEPPTQNGSVYCMAGSVSGYCFVSGSTDKTISVWDTRTGDRVLQLRGHSDAVRCLTLKYDAFQMLSGGTDATVKLWDLRQERCIRSFDSFADSSVWAVTATRNFDAFVTGSRDGSVWHTDIAADVASMVVPAARTDLRESMVLDVAFNPCKKAVWVSTTGSTVRLWPLPSTSTTKVPDYTTRNEYLSTSEANGTAYEDIAMKSSQPNGGTEPICSIPGLPGIIAHRVMNDRRHVLTCDTQGDYNIWDITRGILEKPLGKQEGRDIDEVVKEHDIEVSVPSWFQVDIRLGSLSVRLDKSSFGNAEIYAVDAGLELQSEEVKVNVGEHVVRALFNTWCTEWKKRLSKQEQDDDDDGTEPNTSLLKQKGTGIKIDIPPYTMPDHISVIVTEDRSPVPVLRQTIGSFQGTEEDLMPSWVIDLLKEGKGPQREVSKISFSLEPADGSRLPQLSPSSLNAPRVLRVKKVTGYISKELKDARTGLDFEIEANHLEVLCNGQPLPEDMSLATVRQFRWRCPEDLQLYFRLRAPG